MQNPLSPKKAPGPPARSFPISLLSTKTSLLPATTGTRISSLRRRNRDGGSGGALTRPDADATPPYATAPYATLRSSR